jgi:hypothetical protein
MEKYSGDIEKIIRHYGYTEEIDQESVLKDFLAKYDFFTDKDTLKNHPHAVYMVFTGIPRCHHIAAKNLLFRGNADCWKFFDRTAHFLAYSQFDDYIDNVTPALMYALYLQRTELVELLLNKLASYLQREHYRTNKLYIKQEVYPLSYLIHFLIQEYGIHNALFKQISAYGKGPGIYEPVISHWNKPFAEMENEYWAKLCNYHLQNLKGTNRNNEEHLWYGLAPMELINMMLVRKKNSLDSPVINHDLLKTPMAVWPPPQTDYNPALDVKFQLVHQTVLQKKKFTYNEMVDLLKQNTTSPKDLFY